VIYSVLVSPAIGRVDVGLVQRADSGVAVDVNGSVDTRPYVTNPGYITPIGSVPYYFIPRGDFRWDPVYSTDLSFTWGKRLSPIRNAELFFRGVITNLFNNAAITRGDIGINTRFNNTAFQAFTRSRRRRCRGPLELQRHVRQPANFDDYQPARLFSFQSASGSE
jgi:hypothetical protein